MKKLILRVSLSLLAAINLSGKPLIRLSLNESQIGLNESARLLLTIENASKITEVQIEGKDNFELSSPNISQRSSFGMGQNTSLYQLQYALIPKKQGTFKLRALVVTDLGPMESNTVEIRVTEERKQQPGDLNAFKSGPSGIIPQTRALKTKVYVGEPFVLEYQLYSREYEIQKFAFLKGRVFDDFLKLFETREDFEGRWSNVGQERYIFYDAGKNVLSANESGQKNIPPQELRAIVYQVFNYKNLDITMPGREITVLPLPLEGKPKDFSGLAGTLKLEHEKSSTRLQYGEALTLKLKIRGSANLNLLSRILDDKNDALKIYEYVKDTYEEIQGDAYQVERNYDIILIPKKSGKVRFTGIKIPFFNTSSKAYQFLEVPPFDIDVQGGPQENRESSDVKVIALAKPAAITDEPDTWQISFSPFLLLNLLALLLLAAAGFYIYIVYKPFQRTPLRSLKKLHRTYQTKRSISEEELLYSMIEIVLKIKLRSTGLSELRQTDLPTELLHTLLACLNYLENKKFGGVEEELNWSEKIKFIYEGFCAYLRAKKTSPTTIWRKNESA